MNNWAGVGRLTQDVKLSYTPNGIAVANFTLAINRPFSNQAGEREADFINIVTFRKPAENCSNYLKKGSLVGVTGRLQSRNYEGQDGKRIYIWEVVADHVQFLDSKSDSKPNNSDKQQSNTNSAGTNQSAGNQASEPKKELKHNDDPFANVGQPIDITSDDLPF